MLHQQQRLGAAHRPLASRKIALVAVRCALLCSAVIRDKDSNIRDRDSSSMPRPSRYMAAAVASTAAAPVRPNMQPKCRWLALKRTSCSCLHRGPIVTHISRLAATSICPGGGRPSFRMVNAAGAVAIYWRLMCRSSVARDRFAVKLMLDL